LENIQKEFEISQNDGDTLRRFTLSPYKLHNPADGFFSILIITNLKPFSDRKHPAPRDCIEHPES